ncbi:PAS domain-containing sensor histidine kinase [Stutzerimonas marianensis]
MQTADTYGTRLAADSLAGPTPFEDSTLDRLPMAVCTLDADGAVLRYNRMADRLCGGGLANDGRLRILCADGQLQPLADTPLGDTLRTGRATQDVTLLIERADGIPAAVLANVDALRSDTGQITGAILCFQCSTPGRARHADQRHQVEWLRAIVDNTPECVKVVDRDGTLLQMNPAGLRMVEASAPDVVEGGCVIDLIAPEHRDSWREHHQRVCDGEKLSWQFDVISLKGTRRHMETHAVPMSMPGDGKIGKGRFVQLAITHDITERKRLESAHLEAELRLRNLLDALPTAVYTTDAKGVVTYFNQACVELAGRVPQIGTDEWSVVWRLCRPDGTVIAPGTCPMAVALAENRSFHGVEALAQRPDGSYVPFLGYPAPLRNKAGEVVGAVNMMVDITERKVAEDHRQLLLNELNHRVKNTLATVQSIASQSFRRDSGNESYRWFEARLIALSKAHDVLSRENWDSADLRDVVEQATAPFQVEGRQRFAIDGPGLRLRPKTALALAMAVHELCTNAGKYGALSSDKGIVQLEWTLEPRQGAPILALRWQERGGPLVVPPERKGFGSRLLERGLAGELNAQVRLAFLSGGLNCEMEVPLQ